jgi:hypothetical protein
MTQAAARSSQPTAARAATMPLASRLRSIQTWEYIIRHVCSHAHTWEHLIRHVHAGDARPLPMNPREGEQKSEGDMDVQECDISDQDATPKDRVEWVSGFDYG